MRIKHLIMPSVVTGVIGAVTFIAVDELRKKVIASSESPAYRVMGPPVSVVIPALEEQDYLPQLVTSIQNQTYEPIDVIVADSSPPRSHELSEEICSQYGATCLYVPQLGVAHARNEGVRHAQGDILVLTDADNVLAPDCIEKLVGSLREGYIAAHRVECIIDDNGLAAFSAVWTTNWLKKANATTRAVAIWKHLFDQVQYDEACGPNAGVQGRPEARERHNREVWSWLNQAKSGCFDRYVSEALQETRAGPMQGYLGIQGSEERGHSMLRPAQDSLPLTKAY